MKKYILHILILVVFIGFLGRTTQTYAVLCDDFGQPAGCVDSTPNTTCTPDDNGTIPEGCGGYQLLSPIPCPAGSPSCTLGSDGKYTFNNFDPTSTDGPNTKLGEYLNLMIKIFIGFCAVAAVGMIVIGGVEYMTSELISGKEAGKERIEHAILGLVIALSSYALLNTINPNILNTEISSMGNTSINVRIANSIYTKPVTAANTARCVPVASGPCATSNLSSTFGSRAEGMSKICNIESGGNANAVSSTDIGTDGTPFSFGLLQINLLANGSVVQDSAGNSCANLFVLSNGSPIVGNNYIKVNASGRTYYDAKLKPGMESRYASCRDTLLNPQKNLEAAYRLFQQGNTPTFGNNPMFAWSGDVGVCSSAFQ
jgi:hypothetical protein